jgi:hypothetical protein
MKTYQVNLLNSLTLILMPLWAFLTFEGTLEKPDQSPTAFIPLLFGVVLLLCNRGLKKENKIIAHIAVLVTLVALLGLTMPLKAAIIDQRTLSIIRVVAMLLTGSLAMISFIKSFIAARKNKQKK